MTIGGAIANMSQVDREMMEQFVLRECDLAHPYTGEILPRKNGWGISQPLKVRVIRPGSS